VRGFLLISVTFLLLTGTVLPGNYSVFKQYCFVSEDEVTLGFLADVTIKEIPNEQNLLFLFSTFQSGYSMNINQVTYKRIQTMS
jgi:hypothetical protein